MRVNTVEEFIKKFENANDVKRWRLVKDNQHLNFQVAIDNDDISIWFEDCKEDYDSVSFNEFGDNALNTLLNSLNIKSDFV